MVCTYIPKAKSKQTIKSQPDFWNLDKDEIGAKFAKIYNVLAAIKLKGTQDKYSLILEAPLAPQGGSELKNMLNFNCQYLVLQLSAPFCLVQLSAYSE